MKTLPFAIVALVLSLTCGDTTSPLNFNTHISDNPYSNVEALSVDPFVFQDAQAPLTNDDVTRMFGAGLTETTIVQLIQKVLPAPEPFDPPLRLCDLCAFA